MFVFVFVLEKYLLQKAKCYVNQILEIKKVKTDISKSYFDVTLQTETTALRELCSLLDKNFTIKRKTVVYVKKRKTQNQFD